jgi:calcium/calmodulin-dependent protein kinase I
MSTFQSFLNRVSGQPESYKLKAEYRFGKTLGAGTFGIVKRATHIPTNEDVAVKIILKKNLHGNEQMVIDELQMLQRLHHPHIVAFKSWFESREKYYIVTQLATGGELFDRICDYGKFTEKDGVATIREVLDAISYLHKRDIVHRDLKPENLLYLTSAPDSSLVLADFGIAKPLKDPNQKLTSMAGSFGYAAPEVLLGTGHGKPCDIWSLGVITYTILSGYSPFRAETIDDFLTEVEDTGFLVFHERYWKTISPEAKQFISKMLDPNPEKRPTATELLNHPWIADEKAANATENLLPNIRVGFNARQKLRKGIEAVRLANRIAALKLDELEEGEDGEPTPTLAARLAKVSLATRELEPAETASTEAKSGKSMLAFQEVVRAVTRNKDLLNGDQDGEKKEEDKTKN